MVTSIVAAAIGGAFGAAGRHMIQLACQASTLSPLVAIPLANGLGCFLVGVAVARLPAGESMLRVLIVTGFLGGLTSFSSYSIDVISLWEHRRVGVLGLYLFGGLALNILLTGLGGLLGQR